MDAIKPIISGFDPARAGDSDCGVLLRALGLPLSDEEIEDISPWRFAAALSPDMAARHEGKEIDFEQLVSFCETAIEEAEGDMLIEGVGGVMVPLDQKTPCSTGSRHSICRRCWSPAAISAASAIR